MLPVGLMGIGNPSGPGKDGGHQNVKESLPFIPKKVRFFCENDSFNNFANYKASC